MNCCTQCFLDNQIREIITRLNLTGNCDFCSSQDVSVYPVGERTEIEELLESVIDLYAETDSAPDAKPLYDALSEDWSIVSGDKAFASKLLSALCPDRMSANNQAPLIRMAIPQLRDNGFLEEYGLVKGRTWSEFSQSIKYDNRFHSNLFNPKAFATYLSYSMKKYKKGDSFYRARICPYSTGYSVDEMGAPPLKNREAGRISPEGVGVLYLASDETTALSEKRAYTHDFVTVGHFELLDDLTIIDLSEVAEFSPFLGTDNLAQYAANRQVFAEISREIAKPQRRNESPLEYLPTQYISEFIKSQGYRGVKYISTMNKEGYNLAIFDSGNLEGQIKCIDVRVVEIQRLKYETIPMNEDDS